MIPRVLQQKYSQAHSGAYPIGKNEGLATMAEPISYDDFARLELRVAKVSEARPHPHADKLLLSS